MKSERIPVKSFSADNGFIGKMQKLVREEVLPYQYNILNDAIPGIEKSHAIENIRLLFQGVERRHSGSYDTRQQRENKKFRCEIIQEINLLAHCLTDFCFSLQKERAGYR